MHFWSALGALAILSVGFSQSAWTQGASCSDPIFVSGEFAGLPFVANGVSGMPSQACNMLAGASDVFAQWTATEGGNYYIDMPATPTYSSLELYRGTGCTAVYETCDQSAHPDGNYIRITYTGILAGETFLLRGIGVLGTLQILQYECSDAEKDALEDNNNCLEKSPIGNGTYVDLSISRVDVDLFSFCLADGDTLDLHMSPRGVGPFVMHAANGNQTPCEFTSANVLIYDYGAAVSGSYTNHTGEDIEVHLRIYTLGIPCEFYDLTVSGANGCNGTPSLATFCDPMTPNSTGIPTELTTLTGAGSETGIRFECSSGPPGHFASFIVGTGTSVPGLPLGNGFFCLAVDGGNQFGRYNVAGTELNSIGIFDGDGAFQNLVGTSQTGFGFDVPSDLPSIGGQISAGQTWHFQMWHRETNGGSNFSNGVSVTF